MVKPITLLTDFGDFYPGVMKGVILKVCPNATIIDITHSVEPQNIYQGAFLLYHSYRFFPEAIHVAVVDPGVGSSRKAIAIECSNHVFIGPDNGILYPSACEDGIRQIWVIDESKTSKITGVLSTTFHGRDVFAPASAYAAMDKLDEVAEPFDGEICKLDLFDYIIEENKIICRIIFIDRFGNAVTNVKASDISSVKGFYVNGVEFPLVRTYSDVEMGEPLALIGSFETLELSVRNGNAAEMFGFKSGEIELTIIK